MIILIVDTFVQTHRMYNVKSEPSCKAGTSGVNGVSIGSSDNEESYTGDKAP